MFVCIRVVCVCVCVCVCVVCVYKGVQRGVCISDI